MSTKISLAAGFIKPMECLPVNALPEGPEWSLELKLDGYRMEAVCTGRRLELLSRRNNSFTSKFPHVASALSGLPAGTVLDGELVALDHEGRPRFSLLQNHRSSRAPTVFFAFDILFHRNRDLTRLGLEERRDILRSVFVPSEYAALNEPMEVTPTKMVRAVRELGLEGIVAKRKTGCYEPGLRTGSWRKFRLNLSQEFVIGGFMQSPTLGVDSLIVGFYRGKDLIYAGRVRAGLIPATRRQVFEQLHPMVNGKCPFVNLPETSKSAWGQGLTAERMKDCIWVRPEKVVQVEFLEWNNGDRLRHTKFIGLRHDKNPKMVVKET
jgi:bifunctional non-homologous end joining protein LigD